MSEFDEIAEKLWSGDLAAIETVDGLTDRDRMHVEQRLLTLYGVSVNLFGTISDIKAALEIARKSA